MGTMIDGGDGDVGQGNDGDDNVNDVHIAGVDGNVDVKKRKHPASAHLRPAVQRSHQLHWAGRGSGEVVLTAKIQMKMTTKSIFFPNTRQ